MRPAEPYLSQLARFARQVLLPAVPRLAWVVLGLVGSCILNLLFLKELWPHCPKAEVWFGFLIVASLTLLPWLAAHTAQLVRQSVRSWWWQALWQLVAVGAYLGAFLLSMLFCLGLLNGLVNGLW